ncbi:MAG: sigma-54-dependent Fis family transcriptional regulator [Phycisphaerae bacterium]
MGNTATITLQKDGLFIEQRRLTSSPLTIGRADSNHLMLADPTVSREHARIDFQNGRHVVVDLTGKARVSVNGEVVEQRELQTGDQITVGPFRLVYQAQAAAVAVEEPDTARTETLLAFSPAGQPLLRELARLAGEARLDARQERLWAAVGQLRECTSVSQTTQTLAREAVETLFADMGQVVYPTEDEGLTVGAVWPADEDARHPLSASVVRQVLATGQALVCLDVGQDRRFRASISLAGRQARSVLAAPVVSAGRVSGAVCLIREATAEQFSLEDLEALCTLTQVAGDVLQDAAEASANKTAGPLRRQADLPYPLVYRSEVMRGVTQQVLRVAATDATVLVTGPSGSGKELIAAALHYGSLRSAGPFVKVNCAAIPETLIESELFGHERGAFTDAKAERRGRFEQADGGTLFLDEIGDMPLTIQTRLLRALETRQIERVGGSAPIHVRVRLIAATHHHLASLVKQGRFREDLWYRLDVVRLDLPALKDRSEDVALLFEVFAHSFAASMQTEPVRLSSEAEARLRAYEWPGNVRQLRNLAERLTVFHAGQEVSADVVEMRLRRPEDDSPQAASTTQASMVSQASGALKPLAEARTDFERAYIRRALAETEGNITRAAELLGLARENLSRKIKQLGIEL